MFCKKCGREIGNKQKYCVDCDTSFGSSWSVGKIIVAILFIVIIGGFGVYNSMEEEAIETNNQGISSFDSGDSMEAIGQFKQSLNNATTEETKIVILKNLAYAYLAEGEYDLSLESFKEALTYAGKDSFDYFLISGEIALLNGNPGTAQTNYNKAYKLNPNDFQINNALNLFYLDVEDIAPRYVDYLKALQYAQKAYDVSDIDIRGIATENLAIAHFFNENYNQTILLLSSLDIAKKPYLNLWLGLAFAGNEDISNAKFYFRKAINYDAGVPQEVYDYLNDY